MIEKLVSDSFLDKLKEVMNTPIISKYDLRIGNMFEQGIVWKISGRAGAKVHLHGKGKWYKGFRSEVAVEHLKPILLTHQILTEWCGFEFKEDGCVYTIPPQYDETIKHDAYHLTGRFFGISCTKEGKFYCGAVKLDYLHELQNLFYVVKKKELEIKG